MKRSLMLFAPAVIALTATLAPKANAQANAQAADGAVAAMLRRAGVAPTEGALNGTDPKARAQVLDALERSYNLPAGLRDSENTLPPNPGAVMDQLGLVRRQGVPVTDLSGRTPTAREITDALGPR